MTTESIAAWRNSLHSLFKTDLPDRAVSAAPQSAQNGGVDEIRGEIKDEVDRAAIEADEALTPTEDDLLARIYSGNVLASSD